MAALPASGLTGPEAVIRVLRLFSRFSVLSVLFAGLLGSVVMARLGPPLAMLAAMYAGNTEPETPTLPFPWWTLAALTAVVIGSLLVERRGDHPVLWVGLAHLCAIGTVVLDVLHLWRLVGSTGGAT